MPNNMNKTGKQTLLNLLANYPLAFARKKSVLGLLAIKGDDEVTSQDLKQISSKIFEKDEGKTINFSNAEKGRVCRLNKRNKNNGSRH